MLINIKVVSVVCLVASTVLLQVSPAPQPKSVSGKPVSYMDMARGKSNYIYWATTKKISNMLSGIKQFIGLGGPNYVKNAKSIPIIYVSGTHYDIGFNIGRTFGKMIRDFLRDYEPLHEDLLPRYNTQEGRNIYDESYMETEKYFPQYIYELKGTADGAGVPFVELFLMVLDDTLIMNMDAPPVDKGNAVGCSTIMVNRPNEQLLGHTEDALSETINNYYIIAAHIVPSDAEKKSEIFQAREEKFKALTYAGHLPGYASGFNHHGLVFSINTIFIKSPRRGNIPREFWTRAMLASEANKDAILKLLINDKVGTADGFNVNLGFWKMPEGQKPMYHTIEVTPSVSGEAKSDVAITDFNEGSVSLHTNRLLKSKYPEAEDHPALESSKSREKRYVTLTSVNPVKNLKDLLTVLGNREDKEYPVFSDQPGARVSTINLGVFDLKKKTWTIWTQDPSDGDALVRLPLGFMDMIPSTPRIPYTRPKQNVESIESVDTSTVDTSTVDTKTVKKLSK